MAEHTTQSNHLAPHDKPSFKRNRAPEPMDDTQPGALTAVDAMPRVSRQPPPIKHAGADGADAETTLRASLREQAERIKALEAALSTWPGAAQSAPQAAAPPPPPPPAPAPVEPPSLRRFAKRAKRALGRQVFAFPLQPLQDVERAERDRVTYRCTGSLPQFALNNPDGRLPYGWVKIRTRLVPREGSLMSVRLYMDTGAGFHKADSYALPMPHNANGDIEDLRFIAPGLHQMRLDVSISTGEDVFVLESISVQEMTKQEALGIMLLRSVKERQIPPNRWPHTFNKLVQKLRTVGVAGSLALLQRRGGQSNAPYASWVREHDTLSDDDRAAIKIHMQSFAVQPRISVVMPIYNPPAMFLRRAIESVQAQLYDNWELCLADDASSLPYVGKLLRELAAQDARIKIVQRKTQGHICAATNDALALATGQFVTFLDHDDELREHALYMLTATLQEHPEAKLIYSDEDKIDEHGERRDAYFKSAWNPDLLHAQNYINHLACYSLDLVRQVGNLRIGYEGSQDYDLALRVSQKLAPHQIQHVPHVLYFWRAIAGSTAHTPNAKPYTFNAAQRALQDDLARRGEKAEVILRPDGFFRTRYALPDKSPMVSIIIPTRDYVDLLRQCVDSITAKSTYTNYEIIIVDNDSAKAETHAYLDAVVADERIRVLPYHKVFNYAAINNAAAKIARGDVLCLLNNDIEIITPEWLEELASQAMRPDIGAVGAKLYYANGVIQHAGVVLGVGGIAGHSHKHLPGQDPGSFSRANLTQNYAAVTGACLAIRRDTYDKLGGLDEALQVAYNDVDFCLRVRELGLRNLWTPYVEMYHHESASRGTDFTPAKLARANRESDRMRKRWGELLNHDPYYNPNLTLVVEDFSLALPPRAPKPWRNEGPMRPF